MKLHSRVGAVLVPIAALLVLPLVFAAAPAASQDSDPTAKLGVWAGRWTYHAQTYETPYSHAYAYDGTADCSWSPNHGFMVCDFLNHNPAPGAPVNDLGIFSYDPRCKDIYATECIQGVEAILATSNDRRKYVDNFSRDSL